MTNPTDRDLRVDLLTREYPPEVYGGAGVHVEYLARELAAFVDVEVHAWGGENAVVHSAWDALAGDAPELAALRAMSVDLSMAAGVSDAQLVHSHTWYAQLAREVLDVHPRPAVDLRRVLAREQGDLHSVTRIPLGITTTPPSETWKRSRSFSGSTPISTPSPM